MREKTIKTYTFSFPIKLIKWLSYVSEITGLKKSTIITRGLEKELKRLQRIYSSDPDNVKKEDTK